jgi:hypothetical protein
MSVPEAKSQESEVSSLQSKKSINAPQMQQNPQKTQNSPNVQSHEEKKSHPQIPIVDFDQSF